MWITRQKTRLQELYREFPRPTWTLRVGLVMDNGDARLLYWISGLLGLLAAAANIGLHTRMWDEPKLVLVGASD